MKVIRYEKTELKVVSFFKERRHLHHFATEQDVAEEFFKLLSNTREFYLQDVIADGKRYDRYVDDFVNSHQYIDCENAICRNCHEMNICIAKGLLTDCTHLVKPHFAADSFSFEVRIEDMKALFACKEGFRIRVNKLRHMTVLFNTLLENSFIQSRWQSVLDKGGFLLSKDDERSVSASSLSSALSAVRNNVTSVAIGIRRAVDRLKK